MAEAETQASAAEAGPLFRPSKRRKFYRKRDDDEGLDQTESTAGQLKLDKSASEALPSDATSQDDSAGAGQSMAEILRLRKLGRARKGGIAFTETTENPRSGSGTPFEETSAVLVVQDEAPDELKAVTGRFAPQTGQVADVDKHMMAFIDAEITKRLQGITSDTKAEQGSSSQSARETSTLHSERQPASLGKLHEIDLGPTATLTNIERTAAAQQKLEDGSGNEVGASRLGKAGQPRRGQKRRTSEDIRRDKLVEEVLRESRLEIYDDPDPFAAQGGKEGDLGIDAQMAADDRIAEQFRREFMDAVSSRQRRRVAPPSTSSGGKKDDRPKGPKLGGSRSARAAMREMQEKQGTRK